METYELFLKKKGTIGGWYQWVQIDEKTPTNFKKEILQGQFAKLLKHIGEQEDEKR